jgi:hypothetical protein
MVQTAPPVQPRPIPGRIGAVLKVLLTLIVHGRHLAATANSRAAAPEFATTAAVFGTYDLPVILHRIQRGILRALALQRYLLARAARGRNLRFRWPPYVDLQPHHRPPARQAAAKRDRPGRPRTKEPALLGPGDPGSFCLPTAEELDAEVRRRPVGRTIAFICLDLGITPVLCEGEFWDRIEKTLWRYGGSLYRLYLVRIGREQTFQRERDRRPDTWHIEWRPGSKSAVRQALGYLIGETPQIPGPHAIVPS